MSVSENIAQLLNAAPSFHAEEDEIDETSAKVFPAETKDVFIDDFNNTRSKIRLKNSSLLEELDSKYTGKKSSRKDLGILSDASNDDFDYTKNSDVSDQSSAENIGEEDLSSDQDSEIDHSDDGQKNEDFQHFSAADSTSQNQKNICVRNQIIIWEKLLEIRIQLQKCLLSSNKLPIGKKFTNIKRSQEDEFSKIAIKTEESLAKVLDNLLFLQKQIVNNYPETKKIFKDNNIKTDDEEIISNSEESCSEHDSEPTNKKRKLENFEQEIQDRHRKYTNYRNNVIQKWNEKTRIAMITKNNPSQNIINQIDHILSDKQKLIKKSQLKKSNYNIIDESDEESNDLEPYNENIYDDGDFYHQLLKELIEFKSSDITDPVQLGQQWIKLQNLRSKMKRKLDTKATKGRKIRYAVHPKLINFMAPMDLKSVWTDRKSVV